MLQTHMNGFENIARMLQTKYLLIIILLQTKYYQKFECCRQLADLHSRLATVEEKLGVGQRGDEEGSSSSRMPRAN